MEFLLHDPRPELKQDTNLWTKLLRFIPEMEDKEKADRLLKRLWTFRSAGTQIKPTLDGLKFTPLIGPGNDWDDEAEFEEMKKKYLGPYAKEVAELLKKVNVP